MEDPNRQSPRVKPSRVLVRIASAEALRANYLKDLSEGGLFLRVERPLPVGSEVVLELVPPGWDSALPLSGRVVRVVDDDAARAAGAVGMAVFFENLEPEAEQRLSALIAEHLTPAAGGGAEIGRLKTQIQGLMFELGAAREGHQASEARYAQEHQALLEAAERLRQLDRSNDELLTRCESLSTQLAVREAQAAPDPHPRGVELETAVSEIAALRTELEEAQAQVRGLKSEFEVLEQDEAASRALSERLANEKSELERLRREEGERAAEELERLRAEHARGAQQLDLVQAKARELEQSLVAERAAKRALEETASHEKRVRMTADGRCEALQKQLGEATAARADSTALESKLRTAQQQLETDRARTVKLEQRLVEANAQVERGKVKERDLRRLLSLVSSKTGGDAVVVIEEEGDRPAPAPQPPSVPVHLFRPAREPSPEPAPSPSPAALPGEAPPLQDAYVEIESQTPDEIHARYPPEPESARAPEPKAEIEEVKPELGPEPRPAQETAAPVEAAAASGDLGEQLFGEARESQREPGIAPVAADSETIPDASAEAVAVPAQDEPCSDAGGAPEVQGWTEVPADGVVYKSVPGEVAAGELAPSEVEVTAEVDLPAEVEVTEVAPLGTGATPEGAEAAPDPEPSTKVDGSTIPEDWAFLDLSELPAPAEAPGAAQVEVAEFERRIRAGARLVRTQKFHMHTSTDQAEVMVNAWLEEGDTLLSLVRLARGRLTADRITRVLFSHYSSALIDLAGAG